MTSVLWCSTVGICRQRCVQICFQKNMPNMLKYAEHSHYAASQAVPQTLLGSHWKSRAEDTTPKLAAPLGNNPSPKHRPFTASVFPPFPCVVSATEADVRRRLGLKGSSGAAAAAGCDGTSGTTVGPAGGGTDFSIVQEPYIHRSSSSLAM